MTRIALLTPRLDEGDAVSNDMLGMQDVLRARGHEAVLFAGEWQTAREAFAVKKLASFLKKKTDILLYHYSIAWDVALELFGRLDCVKIIKYHNVTPPEFFDPYHAGIANSCRVGRQFLKKFVELGCDLHLGDSAFNVADLQEAGASEERCRVVPPLHRIERLLGLEADLSVIGEYVMDYPRRIVNFLMVGRIVPNKGYANLIRSFALYREAYNEDSRLLLVGRGDPQLERYHAELHALIDEHGLGDAVIFTGATSEAALKAFYLAADAFVILSEHEGFCVPLVEAMALKTPTVVLGSSAIPETAGDAGLIWEEPDPRLFAASMNRIVTDEQLSQALCERGRRRYREHFTNEKIGARLLDAMSSFL